MEFHLYKILKEAKVICSVRKQIRVQSRTDYSWEQGTFSVMNMSLGLNCGGYTGILICQNSVNYINTSNGYLLLYLKYASRIYCKSHKYYLYSVFCSSWFITSILQPIFLIYFTFPLWQFSVKLFIWLGSK